MLLQSLCLRSLVIWTKFPWTDWFQRSSNHCHYAYKMVSSFPLSLIIAIVTSVTTFLFIILVCLCYFRTKIIRKLAMFSGSGITQSTPTGPSAEADTGVRSVSTEGVRTYLRASLPPSPKEDGKGIVRHLYPKLDFSTTTLGLCLPIWLALWRPSKSVIKLIGYLYPQRWG